MDPASADDDLRRAVAAFERAATTAPPAPALPALTGLLRGVGALLRLAAAVALGGDRRDPIALEPRALRAS